MLILSLELVKNRMGAMLGDLRRIFLSNFTTLIEKSPVGVLYAFEIVLLLVFSFLSFSILFQSAMSYIIS